MGGCLGRSDLRLGGFFADTSGLMVRLAGECESLCKSLAMVDDEARDELYV
jgi:hypothetical protein